MYWHLSSASLLSLARFALGTFSEGQIPLSPLHDGPTATPRLPAWDEPLTLDATGHLVFQSLVSLMQMAPNSKYPNGHAIVRGTVPTGTLLYHGRSYNETPTRDWLAFDPEHSQLFTPGANGTLFTFVTTRDVNVLYFDGCSATKFDGVVDTQDILIWGQIDYDPHDGWFGELARMNELCAWGKQYGIDGFVRMQVDFEFMYCDVSDGLGLVSVQSLIVNDGFVAPSPGHNATSVPEAAADVVPPPPGPLPIHRYPMIPPEGWKGTLPSFATEVMHTGTWHNNLPGDLRVRVDPSTMISFYDPALTSLVQARRTMKRRQYRLWNISDVDVARVQADITDMMGRDPALKSGVDWQGLAHTIQNRFSDRLPYVRHLLHQPITNASAQAQAVRREILVSLFLYMRREDTGKLEWLPRTAHACTTKYTSHLPTSRFTKQEHLLYNAVKEVLHEICRVYTTAWRDAFDVEAQSVQVATSLLEKWRGEFDRLIEWLDWPVWMKCRPECGVDEFCYFPQGAVWEVGFGIEPECIPLNNATLDR